MHLRCFEIDMNLLVAKKTQLSGGQAWRRTRRQLLNLFEEQRARHASRSRQLGSKAASAAQVVQPRVLADLTPAISASASKPLPFVDVLAAAAGVPAMDEDAAVAFLTRSWATEMQRGLGAEAPHKREAPAPPPAAHALRASVGSVRSVVYEDDFEDEDEPDKENSAGGAASKLVAGAVAAD